MYSAITIYGNCVKLEIEITTTMAIQSTQKAKNQFGSSLYFILSWNSSSSSAIFLWKLFNQYRDISFGERNEREAFEHGLGVVTT